jgi:hypothetical protein
MEKLERIMSRPVAKPYRSRNVKDSAPPFLNADGLLDFSPGDIESMCILSLIQDVIADRPQIQRIGLTLDAGTSPLWEFFS